MKKKILLGILILCLMVPLLAGCGDDNTEPASQEEPTLQSIAVNPVTVTVGVDETMQFWAMATYSDDSTGDVTSQATWSSSDTTVATISAEGLATAKASGESTIIATLEGENASATLAVSTVAPATVTIVDSAGRQVELPQPLDRIVALHTDVAEAIRALGAKDKIVGVTKYMANEPEFWPELKDKTNCGSSFTPNYETILELDPQAVIVYSGTFGFSAPSELEEKMAPAGIKVVKLDCYKPTTLSRDISTLGIMLGEEDRATELINFFEGYLSTVNSGVKKLKADEKARVYFEQWTDYKSVAEGAGYHDMILAAGGINIFAGAGVSYPVVSPEAILDENPDIVVKNTQVGGYAANDASELESIRNDLLARAGWDTLEAVMNNRVYTVSNEIVGGTKKPIGICFMAKWFYPDKFQDLDPEAMMREYIEDYQGLTYQGVYTYSG